VTPFPPFDTTDTVETDPTVETGEPSHAVWPDAPSAVMAARLPAPRLLLAPSRGDNLSGLLGSLVRLYHLDVHGPSRLTRRAGMEMKFVAVMLTIIFLFDLAAWTFLWNMILHSGVWRVGLLTPVALFCGFIFSLIIFVYERQFMTADTHNRLYAILGAMTLRVLVIVIAAIVTTQPIEVAVFNGPIGRRIHEESVRNEAVNRLRALEEARSKSVEAGHEGTVEMNSYKTAQERAEEARKEAGTLKARRDAVEASLRRAQDSAAAARRQAGRSGTERGRRYWSSVAAAASARAEEFRQSLGEIDGQIRVAEENEKHWNAQTDVTKGEVVKKQEMAKGDVIRLQNWIAQIRNSKPGAEVEENIEQSPKWTFQDEEYDFFQRLSVINDLYAGRPPRWHGATPQDRATLGVEYGLKDAAADDLEELQRQGMEASTFALSWWAVVGIAAIIPLLLLAFKLLLPRDLSLYYSTDAQRRAGNYETLRFDYDDRGRLIAREERARAASNGNGRGPKVERVEIDE
jgi:hypothetical protein